MEDVVIVGAGQGGFQLAASLRQANFQGRITMIGDEAGLPYQRPPLSKEYLKEGDADRLLLRPQAFYDQQRIEVLDGVRVAGIDRTEMKIETADGRRIPYDHLVLATGSSNRIPPIAGLDSNGVMTLRTLTDAKKLRLCADDMRRAVVIGGGFIGLEFAAVARSRGIEVAIVEGTDRLMGRAVSPATSTYFLDMHRGWGSNVLTGEFAEAVATQDGSLIVRLQGGLEIIGDTVLLAAGVMANESLAADVGLETRDGIIVDEFLQSSDPHISALGDCCRFIEPISGLSARLESVQAATDHARTIAARLTGNALAYASVPWFWSNQGDCKLQIAGYAPDADDWHVINADGKLTVFCFSGDKLAAVETVNNAGTHMAARKLLTNKGRIPRDQIAAENYDLKAAISSDRNH